jgi:hypothetical protein
MEDKTIDAPVVVSSSPAPSASPALAPIVGKLLAKSYRVIQEPHAKSPGNEPTDIIEVELCAPYEGNYDWCHPMDAMRYRVERKNTVEMLRLLGLK